MGARLEGLVQQVEVRMRQEVAEYRRRNNYKVDGEVRFHEPTSAFIAKRLEATIAPGQLFDALAADLADPFTEKTLSVEGEQA